MYALSPANKQARVDLAVLADLSLDQVAGPSPEETDRRYPATPAAVLGLDRWGNVCWHRAYEDMAEPGPDRHFRSKSASRYRVEERG